MSRPKNKWYSHLPKECGIYALLNLTNGKVYIGQSLNIHDRGRAHWCFLEGGNGSRHLQKSWNKNRGKIVIGVVELCSPEEMSSREERWIESTKSWVREFGYNLDKAARGSGRRSPETLERMSQIQTGRKHSLETRRKISEANKGQVISEEQRRITSERMKGSKGSDEKKLKCSIASRGYWDNASEESLQERNLKVSQALKGIKRGAPSQERKDHQSKMIQGRRWYNNGAIVKRFYPEEVDLSVWKPGRLPFKKIRDRQ